MINMAVELPKTAYIRDLKKLVGQRMNVDPATVFTFPLTSLMAQLLSAEIFNKKFYKHHIDTMLLADVIPDPSKDDITIYELPDLNTPGSVVLPVFNVFNQKNYYIFRFEEFGIPFYIVLTKDEQSNFEKIYEKIKNKYAQFSSADELHLPLPENSIVLEDDEGDEMEEVVLTRQDVSRKDMVTLRLQMYSRGYGRMGGESEMPVNVERAENLMELKEWLQPPEPPMSRMQSLAPSAMESIHQEVPEDNSYPGNISAMEEQEIQEDIATDEGTTYLSQNGTFIDSHPSRSELDMDETPQHVPQEQDAFSFVDEDCGLNFSEYDVINMDERSHHSSPPMVASDDEIITPSQIGRGHAPSPTIPDDLLPTYNEIYPEEQQHQSLTDQHMVKYGDGIVCEWSDAAYQHVFNNPKFPVHWNNFKKWVDPSSPPPLDTTPKKLNIDLDDCLDEFAREEELGQDDLWYCPRCKEHRQAKKTLQLWRVPDILTIHLKRFSANRGFRDKLDNLIEFPITELNLTERVGDKKWISEERGGEKLIYDLFAVDNHYGGLGGGHYTAYAQNFIDGKWYYFDGTLL
jgi:hypothetical protein